MEVRPDLTDKMKRSFFQAAVVLILLYGCSTWTLIKRLQKKLDGNYTRMLRAIMNKSWRQHPTKHQLYGHLPLITKTIQVRRTRDCWRSRNELIRDVLRWTPTYDRAKAEAMNDRDKWREKVRDIRAGGTMMMTMMMNSVRRDYLESTICYTQQNSKFRLCEHRDETVNFKIRKCRKLAQMVNKTRFGLMVKVIHWELCKKTEFDHKAQWYMREPVSVLRNAAHEILLDFEIQRDHLIPNWR